MYFGDWPVEYEPIAHHHVIVAKFIAIVDEWFWAMEKGEANLRMPDPNIKRYDMDYCDKVI